MFPTVPANGAGALSGPLLRNFDGTCHNGLLLQQLYEINVSGCIRVTVEFTILGGPLYL